MRLKFILPRPQEKQMQVLPEEFKWNSQWPSFKETAEIHQLGQLINRYRFIISASGGGKEVTEVSVVRDFNLNTRHWIRVERQIRYRGVDTLLSTQRRPNETIAYFVIQFKCI